MNCVILGSGKGTNARAILEAWSNNQLGNADIKAVFSENKGATILKIADSPEQSIWQESLWELVFI